MFRISFEIQKRPDEIYQKDVYNTLEIQYLILGIFCTNLLTVIFLRLLLTVSNIAYLLDLQAAEYVHIEVLGVM